MGETRYSANGVVGVTDPNSPCLGCGHENHDYPPRACKRCLYHPCEEFRDLDEYPPEEAYR